MTLQDYETYDLTLKLRDALAAEFSGVVPKTVLNKLHRKYVDVNREKNEATFNEPIPIEVYDEYHASLAEAIATISDPALLIDVHGYHDQSDDPVTWTMFGRSKTVLVFESNDTRNRSSTYD